ncbi:tau 95 subunit of transcription factor TFIIIC [Yamadazyma tenuis]|uniref:Transcription factor IIIC subunit 5 HTH domain-containing protein n=1 Tax=Candida tenuis (strain ATCC 10573 / BCRC 21748 / CBS 615 / JCM 9827 / NBRC 10315 / NRRL Y-1498 / VKM Y-70) TaxID=590646 RepID=G3B971_CANTC|nr:uncharacterized protein CANTEDRAFT_125024 [Yamadazyma tenuis ATCC 10573]EGV61828.1 hypothetical protein CANTEDRAFT_125024 [Yamadazyma tenuis ATCC 10573]WEJ93053.1 tau 95 subunit of transcription factor TFIIIC [Yamadazyma tenuis]
MSKKVAQEFSLDLPHVMAVELPLVVNNTDKAVDMLGGKDKIAKVVNSTSKSIDEIPEETLELRLRKDRFHHPIQSITSTRERVLLKVSVPKDKLPADYEKLSLRDILDANGRQYTAKPVGIISKTHSFKTMTDFQATTKNNALVQEINENLINVQSYDQLINFFDPARFMNNQDYRNPAAYDNTDHQLPPPPVFSTIKFPFDYQYEKNPISITVKDPESGDLKVISKKSTVKLHTLMLDFNTDEIPNQAPDELVKSMQELQQMQLVPNTYNYDLLRCIEYLHELLDVKPIWLRKHLEDVVPYEFKRVLKQALPYVTYIFKNGPWRFCNVKYAVNPKTDTKFWMYQSEYFRVFSLRVKNQTLSSSEKILPRTIAMNNNRRLKISSSLVFDGTKVPTTVTFQVGDIIDKDVLKLLERANEKGSLVREVLDFQDGWINKPVIDTIRRLLRYKLNQLVKNEFIDEQRIDKILASGTGEKLDDKDDDDDDMFQDATEDVETHADETEKGDQQSSDEDGELEQDTVVGDEEEDAMDVDQPTQTEDQILRSLSKVDSVAAKKLANITELIKQEAFM